MELSDWIRWSWTLGLVGLLALGGAASTWFLTGTLDGTPTTLAVIGAVCLVAYGLLDRERLGESLTTRSAAYAARSSLAVALAAGVAVAAYGVSRSNDQTWDLTEARSHTLSDHARRVASALDTDIQVTAFFRSNAVGRKGFRDLIRLFEEVTDRLEITYVDPLRDPTKARAAEITGDHGTVLFEAGDRVQRMDWEITEEEVVRALVLLQSEEDHQVCWSVGHGEPDPDDEFSEFGLGVIRLQLEQLNYQVLRQPIAQQGVARSCDVVVLVSPTVELAAYEREAVAAYVAEGGRLLVLLDPGLTPELAADLERYGILVGDDEVRDANQKNQLLGVGDLSVAVLSAEDFASHPITQSLAAALVMPAVRSVAADLEAEGLSVRELLRTSPDAWAEQTPEVVPSLPDPATERMGEIPVMAVSVVEDPAVLGVAPHDASPADATMMGDSLEGREGRAVPADLTPAPGGRVVVLGDSDFASNRGLSWGNNRDLFLNAVAWLVEEEDQLGERPEQGDTLEITAFGQAMLCLISLVFVPGAAIVLAILTFLRRRTL